MQHIQRKIKSSMVKMRRKLTIPHSHRHKLRLKRRAITHDYHISDIFRVSPKKLVWALWNIDLK